MESVSGNNGSGNTSGSEEDENDDDHRHGHGNKEVLYSAMCLSVVMAVFLIFALVAFHVTYLGPHNFHRQKTTVTVVLSASW